MVFNIFVLAVATISLCEGKIEVPGLEDFQKCQKSDIPCITVGTNKLIKALSQPFPKYGVEGYDPITIDSIKLINPKFHVDQYMNDIVVTGFGDSKVVDLVEKDSFVQATFESNLKFAMKAKITFRQQPEVVREGVISGEFVGLKSHYTYSYKMVPRNGEVYVELDTPKLVGVEMPNKPHLNLEQHEHFISHPDTQALVKNVFDNALEFYKPVAVAFIQHIYPQHFKDRNSFYKHVPVSEFLKA